MAERVNCVDTFKRALLTKGPRVAVAALGTAYGAQEIKSVLTGQFDTPEGPVAPLYERHDQGVTNLPPGNTIAIFVEGPVMFESEPAGQRKQRTFIATPEELYLSYDQENKDLTNQIQTNRIALAFGDAITEEQFSQINSTLRQEITFTREFSKLGTGSMLTFFSHLVTRHLPDLRISLSPDTSKKGFRFNTGEVAKHLAKITGIWLLSDSQVAHLTFTLPETYHHNPVSRLAMRVSGLLSNAHPEDWYVFARNLASAIKIKNVQNYYRDQHGIKDPLVAFTFGSRHSGIEDMLKLPLPLLQELLADTLSIFTKDYLVANIKELGEKAVATRIIVLDEKDHWNDLAVLGDEPLRKKLGI